MCSFRTVRAARDQCAQWMSPNECMQYIQTGFRKGSRVVHAIDYAMQIFSPCDPAHSSEVNLLRFQGQTETRRFDAALTVLHGLGEKPFVFSNRPRLSQWFNTLRASA
jgi:hypothetical protein